MQPTGETYDMISVTTIAKIAHVTVDEAERWVLDSSFPKAVAALTTGDLYDRKATEKWLLEHDHRGMEIPPP